MIWKRQVLVQPVLSMLLANNIACGAKVLWVVDSLLSRLGFLLDDDKTPRALCHCRQVKRGKSEGRNHKPWFVGFLPLVCVWIG